MIFFSSTYLHVLAQRGGVCVGLITAINPTIVGFVRRVHMGVLLPVRGVGESPIAALVLALERLLA